MIFNLPNITVAEYYQLEEKEFEKYQKLNSVLLINDDLFLKRKAEKLTELTYGNVSTLKHTINEPSFDGLNEMIEIVYNIKKRDVLNADIVSYFYALKWIDKSVGEILEMEFKALQTEPDSKMELAGVQRLSVFGDLSALISLGKQFGKAPEEIQSWKYKIVFSILAYNKVYGEVEKEYNKLLTKK